MVHSAGSPPESPRVATPQHELSDRVQRLEHRTQELLATISALQVAQQRAPEFDRLSPSGSDARTFFTSSSTEEPTAPPEQGPIFTFPHRFTAYNHNNEDDFRLCGFVETPLDRRFRIENDFTLACRVRVGHLDGCDGAIFTVEGPGHESHLVSLGFFAHKPELVATIRERLATSDGKSMAKEHHQFELNSTKGWRMPSGQWHHVALVKCSEEMRMYVGGVLVDKKEIPQDAVLYTTQQPQLCIGRRRWCGRPCNQFDGSIEDVKVWNRGLSEDEMQHESAMEGLIPE